MARKRITLHVAGEEVHVSPPRVQLSPGDALEFWTEEQTWSMSVDFEGAAPSFSEDAFYVDPGAPKLIQARSGASGPFTYTVRATEKGPRDPVSRSKTADVEISGPD